MKYIIFLLLLFTACTTTKYVPVETIREHHTTDTLLTHDTLTVEATTIIREIDSTAIAAYGITMANKQRAWLIEKNHLLHQISSREHITHDTIHDTIPIIKEVEVPVTKKTETPILPVIIVIAILGVLIYARTH